jgi:predicted Zn-dependent peptidase
MPNIQTHTFPNGFRVIYEEPKYPTEITHVDVFCRAGSAFEPESLRGVSHFIEHMCFKGTKRRPTTRDIFEVYENIGAYFNAYTEKQFTCYVASFVNTHMKQCICTLGDMMLRSKFDKSEYKKELNVVIEENVRNLTDYSHIAKDINESLIYKGSSYAYPIDSMKYHKIVDSWDYKDVIEFYHKYYVPENIMLSVVSSAPFSTILKIIKSCEFVKYDSRKTHKPLPIMNIQPNMALIPQHATRIELMPIPDIKTAYIAIGFRTCSRFSEDQYPLELLRILMGGKFTSRLTMLLREKNGLTYTSSVSTTYYEHSGDMTIFSITDSENIMHNLQHKNKAKTSTNKTTAKHHLNHIMKHLRKTAKKTKTGGERTPGLRSSVGVRGLSGYGLSSKDNKPKNTKRDKRGVLPIIVYMLHDLIHHGITDTELKESKMYMDGIIKMNISKGTKQVEYNGMEWFLGNTEKITPYTNLYKTKYEPITKSEINNIIRKYFTPENMNIVLVGGQLPDKKHVEKVSSGIF